MQPSSIAPIASNERITILDVLRGFAIFGILAVNMAGFATPLFLPGYQAPTEIAWFDQLAEQFVLVFAEGKFYTIFSLLFGLGFAVQLQRAEAKGLPIGAFYSRRLLILFGFGLLHAMLLWNGDILRLYALLGFVLLASRRWSDRTLLITAASLIVVAFALLVLIGGPNGKSSAEDIGMDIAAMAREAYTNGSLFDVIGFQTFLGIFTLIAITLLQAPTVLALFLLGLWLGRRQIFAQLVTHRAVFQRLLMIGLLVGIPLNLLMLFQDNALLSSVGFAFGTPLLAAAYISAWVLFLQTPRGPTLAAPIAKVGRMALSNYVLQSGICSLIFNGYGLGLYEQVGAAGRLALTIVIYLGQIPLSSWWLSRYRYGPLEWLWRSLTYRQRQPFKL